MMLRFGVALVATGTACLALGWLEPAGPLLIILGATCWASALEAALDLLDPEHVRVPMAAAEVAVDAVVPVDAATATATAAAKDDGGEPRAA